MQKTDFPERLKAPEGAEFTGIPLVTFYRLARAGLVPGYRVGRSWRFSRAALEQWIANGGTSQKPARVG